VHRAAGSTFGWLQVVKESTPTRRHETSTSPPVAGSGGHGRHKSHTATTVLCWSAAAAHSSGEARRICNQALDWDWEQVDLRRASLSMVCRCSAPPLDPAVQAINECAEDKARALSFVLSSWENARGFAYLRADELAPAMRQLLLEDAAKKSTAAAGQHDPM
jgi:hypothetical protein